MLRKGDYDKDIFRKRDFPSRWVLICIIAVLFGASVSLVKRLRVANATIHTLEKSEAVLRQSVASNYHVWIMDESCSTQLSNSGMIQLKLKP